MKGFLLRFKAKHATFYILTFFQFRRTENAALNMILLGAVLKPNGNIRLTTDLIILPSSLDEYFHSLIDVFLM